MTPEELTKNTDNVRSQLASGQLTSALRSLRNLTESTMLWEETARIDSLSETYAYLLRYLVEGAEDPGREAMYRDILARASDVLDSVHRILSLRFAPNTLYISTLKSLQSNSLQRLIAKRQSLELSGRKAEAEGAERDIFNNLWTSYPLTEAEAVRNILLSPDSSRRLMRTVVSALMQGLFAYFDEAKLTALLDTYIKLTCTDRADIAAEALTAAILALYRHRHRALPQSIGQRLAAAAETPNWHRDIKAIAVELVHSRDTERVEATIREDIMPEMMKNAKDLMNLGKNNGIPSDPDDYNPEWERILENSDLGNSLKQLSEMQMEGSDVMIMAFGNLKHFGYFNEVANWFIPFTADSSVVGSRLDPKMAQLIEEMPILCSSDKYSLVLAMDMMPEAQRKMVADQFNSQADQFRELISNTELRTPNSENIRLAVKNVLQNLYRFNKLFRRRGEFYSPVADSVNLLALEPQTLNLEPQEDIRLLAELMFKHQMWDDAMDAFRRLDTMDEDGATILQKLGYALARTSRTEEAIEAYREADILDPDNTWLLRNLGQALRRAKRYVEAYDVFTRLETLHPDDLSVTLSLGDIALRMRHYQKAVNHYFKANYNAPDDLRALRGLAWSLLMAGRASDAESRYTKLLDVGTFHGASASDWLNAGHTSLILGKHGEAATRYRHAIEILKGDTAEFNRLMETDAYALRQLGADPLLTAMTVDAALTNNP